MDRSLSNLSPQPLPGEIWAVNASGDFDGETTLRYLIIIREPQPSTPELVTVMVLSPAVGFVSNVNILIPPAISGLSIDTLAQTTNIGDIAIDYLQHRVGHRLTRRMYDLLLATGHPQYELAIDRFPATTNPVSRAAGDRFALHERAWLLALNPTKIGKMSELVAAAIAAERQFIDLSQWWQGLFTDNWQPLKPVDRPDRIVTRRSNSPDRISSIITALKSSNDDNNSRQLISQLTSQIGISEGNSPPLINEIVSILIELIDGTDNEELCWSAIECLQLIDPSHPRTGIGRCKSIESIDGVNLSIQMAKQKDDRIALWVKVLPPADRAYLPIDLQLIISDENNLTLQEIIARSTDRGLQIKFSGEVGEGFNLQLKLGDAHSIDRFVI